MAESEHPLISPLVSYAAVSGALLIPVLVWPLQSIGSGSADFASIWVITASVLLLCAVTADSILYHQPNSLWPYFTTAWILTTSFIVSLALRSEPGIYILAIMFCLHAARSARRLWHGADNWWLWAACARDALAALAIFAWIIVIAQVAL